MIVTNRDNLLLFISLSFLGPFTPPPLTLRPGGCPAHTPHISPHAAPAHTPHTTHPIGSCAKLPGGCRALAPAHLRDPAKPRFDRSLTRPVPQLVGARRLRTLLLSDADYLKGTDACRTRRGGKRSVIPLQDKRTGRTEHIHHATIAQRPSYTTRRLPTAPLQSEDLRTCP